jgi:hypothetical protein
MGLAMTNSEEAQCPTRVEPLSGASTTRLEVASMRGSKVGHFISQRSCSLLAGRVKLAGIRAVLISLLLGFNLAPARAGTEVQGQLDALQLRAENASTREVLEALAASFKLTYELPPNIDRTWNGLYSGSLNRVLARILHDTNYFIKSSDNGIEVIVLRVSGPYDAFAGAASSAAATTTENAVPPSSRPAARAQPASAPKPTTSPPPPPLASYLPDN